jgi:transcriptional regulator GlxA family with amidase domain
VTAILIGAGMLFLFTVAHWYDATIASKNVTTCNGKRVGFTACRRRGRRSGGQSQFSIMLELDPPSDRVRDALEFAREHLHEPLSVERMAQAARISARQFARLFLKETGVTPARAVERLRVEVALPRVQEGTEPIEMIARNVGFGDKDRMRRAFLRIYGQPPRTLRRGRG